MDISRILAVDTIENTNVRIFGMDDVRQWLHDILPQAVGFIITLLVALVVFLVGKKIIKVLLKIIHRNFERVNMEPGVIKFLVSTLKVLFYIVLIMIVAQIIGLETSSVIAILGSCGLAIGLALQGSLANFAGGVLILVSKPFVVGDYIVNGEYEGTVVGIDVIYTTLLTVDQRKVVLPNGNLANSNVVNVTAQPERRMEMSVSVDYSEDVTKVKNLLFEILNGHEGILPDREIMIFVKSFDPSSVNITFRVWVKQEDYWPTRYQLMEDIKTRFDENNVVIPFDQLDVNIKQDSKQ